MQRDKKPKSQMFLGSDLLEGGAEFIPLISSEDEERFNKEELPDELPILPLRNTVLFPGIVLPITVGRDKSIKLIQDAYKGDKMIGVVSQQDVNTEDPSPSELSETGTAGQILKQLNMPDGSITIIIQGRRRIKTVEYTQEKPYHKAKIVPFEDKNTGKTSKEFKATVDSIKELSMQIIEESPNIPSEATFAIKNIESDSFLVNFVANNMQTDVKSKQQMLDQEKLLDRAKLVLTNLKKELQMLKLRNDIQDKAHGDISQQQKEYFLNQQLKTIQEELGGSPQDVEIKEFKKKAEKKKWSKKVKEAFEKEMGKLERMNPAGMEYSMQSNYVETLLELPWGEYTEDTFDLKKSQKILNRDHFGLEKIKDRILEHLAVLKLKGDMKSPIICLAGPPGVGKTSLGKSIADSLGRKYVRVSLGGLRDEAEIRGHRKTYIGAMPGRIIQGLKKAGSSNPVFILDEIDKVGANGYGDPSSAMLEVLDPEQNDSFYDNFVEIDYDLSKVLFIATANNLQNLHPALRDRLEIINLSGYTVEEKTQIASKYLVPKALKNHGIKKDQLKFARPSLTAIVEEYTREAGVRNLEKQISKVIRKVAKKIALEEEYEITVQPDQLYDYLGAGMSKNRYEDDLPIGVVTVLAWTAVGGDILYIESSVTKGKGKLNITGNLGDVMKESAIIAMEYLRANAKELKLDQAKFDEVNAHIHVPEGATPKDGPSAGITMMTALASSLTNRPVKRKVAMTGEITLRGKVLPVGGIKEKILAAKRANVKEIILSIQNQKDIHEIEERYLKGLKFHYVKEMIEVLDIALK